jgi:predicted RNA-binding protein with PUA domain
MQTCDNCHEQAQVVHNVGTPAAPVYWCYLCVLKARGPVCVRCGGSHDVKDCNTPEGFRQWNEIRWK